MSRLLFDFDPSVLAPRVGVDVPDHVAAALGRLPEQFKPKPNINAFLSVLVSPVQPLENAAWQVLTQRTISTAIGAQLDALGYIVGQPRAGLSDDDYRRYVNARVATNNSGGTVERLIKIAKLVLNDSTKRIVVTNIGRATVTVRIVGAINDSLAAILFSFLSAAVGGGVRLILEWSDSPPANTFTLDIGPGLDVGALAGALG